MKRIHIRNIFASLLALFMIISTVFPTQIFAYETRAERVISIWWYNADGLLLTHGATVQSAVVSSSEETITFPEISLDQLFIDSIDGWTPSMESIPAATGSAYSNPNMVTLTLTSNKQITSEDDIPYAHQRLDFQAYTKPEEKTICRTVYYHFYNDQNQIVNTRNFIDVADFIAQEPGGALLPESYTFPELPVQNFDGYTPEISVVPCQTVTAESSDFEVIVKFYPTKPNYHEEQRQVTRTIVYNFYNKKKQLIATEKESDSVTFTVAYTTDTNVQLPEYETSKTFPEKSVLQKEGYKADREIISEKTVTVEDNDFEEVVNYYEESKSLDGWYQIECAGNQNYALDVNGDNARNNTNIQIYQRNSSSAQKFYLKEEADGYYTIRTGPSNAKSVVDVRGSSIANKANILQYQDQSSNNQRWAIQQHADGTVSFIAKHSGKALDIEAAQYLNFANVLQWDYHGKANQKFILVPLQ